MAWRFIKRGRKAVFAVFLSCFVLFSACSGCPYREEEPTRVGSDLFTLQTMSEQQKTAEEGPPVKVINIGPSLAPTSGAVETKGPVGVPSEIGFDNALTGRLKEKLKDAFSARGTTPPDIEIYIGSMGLEAFSRYYEDRGYKIQRTSVPASQIVTPLLESKPELKQKISIENYAGITINQIVVEGANISAADKYIDPETYEIVYKTFVTVTKMR